VSLDTWIESQSDDPDKSCPFWVPYVRNFERSWSYVSVVLFRAREIFLQWLALFCISVLLLTDGVVTFVYCRRKLTAYIFSSLIQIRLILCILLILRTKVWFFSRWTCYRKDVLYGCCTVYIEGVEELLHDPIYEPEYMNWNTSRKDLHVKRTNVLFTHIWGPLEQILTKPASRAHRP
jgi:hypothetical protein